MFAMQCLSTKLANKWHPENMGKDKMWQLSK
jgi:hypothetical protein